MGGTNLEHGEMYVRLKELQRQLEILEIQEEYIKDETKNLKREMIRARVCTPWYCMIMFIGGNSTSSVCSIGDWTVFGID